MNNCSWKCCNDLSHQMSMTFPFEIVFLSLQILVLNLLHVYTYLCNLAGCSLISFSSLRDGCGMPLAFRDYIAV